MQGTLNVTPEKLITTADDFDTHRGTIGQLTNEMTSTVVSLKSAWKGDAAEAYTEKFTNLQADIDRMNHMIQEHVTDLKEMARVYQEAERANLEAASALASDVIQ